MALAHWLQRAARAHPDLPAVAIGKRVYSTYAIFAARAARLAGWLQANGARPGDRVVIFSENRPEYLEALYAAWWAGCAATPIDSSLRGEDLRQVLADAQVEIAFVGSKTAVEAAANAPESLRRLVRFGGGEYVSALRADALDLQRIDPEATAWLFYTAGRSGAPKGAMLSRRTLASMAISLLAEVDGLTPRDAQIQAAPLSDGAGLTSIPTVARAGVNVTPESGAFDEAEAFELAAHWRRASIFVAPTMLRQMTYSGADCDPSAFKTIVSTGDALFVRDAIDALERFGPRLAQVYGQAEFPMTIARLSKHDVADRRHATWREKLGSVGRPFLEAEVSVRRGDGAPAEVGEIGEVCVRGGLRMTGYWRNPAATANSLIEGWLRTGDLGAFDELGYLTLRGRRDETVIRELETVHPREIEEALLAHHDVEQVAVIGLPSPEGPPELIAFVVTSAREESLRRHCCDLLPNSKRPGAYCFLDDLPRAHSGKVLTSALRRLGPNGRRAAG